MKKTIKIAVITTLACLLVAAFGGAALADNAQAAAKPTITVTRVATGKVTIKNGSTYKLKAKTDKGAKLTYKTSKKKVCKVTSKGKLVAKKCGKVTITIKAKKNSLVTTKKIKVTIVKKSKFKKVKKIAFKATQTSLYNGASIKLKIKFNPNNASNKNVTYKSSDTSIATVSATGKVTAKSAGSVKITAISCDKSKKAIIKLNMLGECTHEWKLLEKAHVGNSYQVLVAEYVLCKTCGNRYLTLEEWYEHNESEEVGLTHSYGSDPVFENVYDIEPATYQCSTCGATKSEIPEMLDGEKLVKANYYFCTCGIGFFNSEDAQAHMLNGSEHQCTIKNGYRLVSE